MKTHELIKIATQSLNFAYAPYSNFAVGAAILTSSGNIYTGVNVENVSYGLSVCAERVAIFKAVTLGEKKFKAIAIVADTPSPVIPCGACLQVMAEFDDNLKIIMATLSGKYQTKRLNQLLRQRFTLTK